LHDALMEKAEKTIRRCYHDIEEQLSGVYAVGDALTAVDLYMFVLYRWGNSRLSWPMQEEFPRYTALVHNVAHKTSARAAMVAEGEPFWEFATMKSLY
jgi:glutathione S-transferase